MRHYLLLFLVIVAPLAHAAEDEATHDELRALRDRLISAVNSGDVEAIASQLTTHSVVTWQNGDVSRGREGFRDYYHKMMTGPDHIVESFTTSVDVDDLTILYGDNTGIAVGSSDDRFKLKGGLEVPLHDRWTATLVREEGEWRIASAHVSANVFDNTLLTAANRRLVWALPVAVIIGVLGGWFLGRRRKT